MGSRFHRQSRKVSLQARRHRDKVERNCMETGLIGTACGGGSKLL